MFSWQSSPWKHWIKVREHLPHAVLIQSGDGWGELQFAQSAAQSLLCEKPRPGHLACGACQACNWFTAGNHPDFRLIVPESMAAEPPEEGAEPGKKRSDQIRIEQICELADLLDPDLVAALLSRLCALFRGLGGHALGYDQAKVRVVPGRKPVAGLARSAGEVAGPRLLAQQRLRRRLANCSSPQPSPL